MHNAQQCDCLPYCSTIKVWAVKVMPSNMFLEYVVKLKNNFFFKIKDKFHVLAPYQLQRPPSCLSTVSILVYEPLFKESCRLSSPLAVTLMTNYQAAALPSRQEKQKQENEREWCLFPELNPSVGLSLFPRPRGEKRKASWASFLPYLLNHSSSNCLIILKS